MRPPFSKITPPNFIPPTTRRFPYSMTVRVHRSTHTSHFAMPSSICGCSPRSIPGCGAQGSSLPNDVILVFFWFLQPPLLSSISTIRSCISVSLKCPAVPTVDEGVTPELTRKPRTCAALVTSATPLVPVCDGGLLYALNVSTTFSHSFCLHTYFATTPCTHLDVSKPRTYHTCHR